MQRTQPPVKEKTLEELCIQVSNLTNSKVPKDLYCDDVLNLAKMAESLGLREEAVIMHKLALQKAFELGQAKNVSILFNEVINHPEFKKNLDLYFKEILLPAYNINSTILEKNVEPYKALYENAKKLLPHLNPTTPESKFLQYFIAVKERNIKELQLLALNNYLPAICALANEFTHGRRTLLGEYPNRAKILLWGCLILLNNNSTIKKLNLNEEEILKINTMATTARINLDEWADNATSLDLDSKEYRHRQFARLLSHLISSAEKDKISVNDPIAFLYTKFHTFKSEDQADLYHAAKDAFNVDEDWFNKDLLCRESFQQSFTSSAEYKSTPHKPIESKKIIIETKQTSIKETKQTPVKEVKLSPAGMVFLCASFLLKNKESADTTINEMQSNVCSFIMQVEDGNEPSCKLQKEFAAWCLKQIFATKTSTPTPAAYLWSKAETCTSKEVLQNLQAGVFETLEMNDDWIRQRFGQVAMPMPTAPDFSMSESPSALNPFPSVFPTLKPASTTNMSNLTSDAKNSSTSMMTKASITAMPKLETLYPTIESAPVNSSTAVILTKASMTSESKLATEHKSQAIVKTNLPTAVSVAPPKPTTQVEDEEEIILFKPRAAFI